jgi:peptidoglycan hydrolase-like protein with peptidoglycan-binding domain
MTRRVVWTSAVIALFLLLGYPSRPVEGGGRRAADAAPAAAENRSKSPASRFVRDAQRALRDLGYDVGPVDGSIGPKTRSALLRFQQSRGLPMTGELDAESMARLDIYERLFRARAQSDRG